MGDVTKPRILFVMHLPPPAHGAAAVGETIRCSGRIRAAFDCRFINLSTSSSLAEIGKVSLGKLTAFFAIRRQVKRALREFRPELVYVTPASSGLGFKKDYFVVEMIKKMGFPVVAHFHNKGVAAAGDFLSVKMYRRFFKGLKVILLSERLYPDIEKYIPREDVFICPNGIPDKAHSSAGSTDGVPHLLFLSNLLVAKGVYDLLDAAALLKGRGYRFVLDLAGAPTPEISEADLSEAVACRSLGECCHFHGWVSGLRKEQLFDGADVFVLPTRNDAFPLVVLEAMSQGLPVVATKEGGIPDMVAEGRNGFLVEKGSAPELAGRLAELLEDPALRSRMGQEGRRIFSDRFTQQAFETRIAKILEEWVRSV